MPSQNTAELLADDDVDRGLTLRETANAARISLSTLKLLIARHEGPKVTRPSPGRVIVRRSHFHRWLDMRGD